jgi:hypothetical protein
MCNPNKQLLEQVLADIESDENLCEYIQPDIDSHTNLILHIEVDIGSTSISNGFISSSSFGPCIAFLMQFTSNGQPQCLLSHFDCGFDEHGMRLYQILEQFLNDILTYLLDHFQIPTLVPDSSTYNTILNNFTLIIAGGDIDEAEDIKQAFSLLNMNSNNETTVEPLLVNTSR